MTVKDAQEIYAKYIANEAETQIKFIEGTIAKNSALGFRCLDQYLFVRNRDNFDKIVAHFQNGGFKITTGIYNDSCVTVRIEW